MTRKQHLDELHEAGYMAGLNSQPCEAPTRKELERAAWEIGWRIGKSDLKKAVQQLEDTYQSIKKGQ